MKKIEILIDPLGNISIEGKGFLGAECHEFIKEIADALGTTTSYENKNERVRVMRNNRQNTGG